MDVNDNLIYKIYKPAKTATQSGLGNTRFWHLKVESNSYYVTETTMEQVFCSNSSKKYVILKFDSLEMAILYAKKQNAKYIIEMPKIIKRRPKSYANNFITK